MEDEFDSEIPELVAAETIHQLQLGEDLNNINNNPIQAMAVTEPMAVTDMYFTDSRDQSINELTKEIKMLHGKIHELTAMVQSMQQQQQQQQTQIKYN
ncbi:unknown protein [Seminavis robusta]|uniref:Uncharacterized protein n=1 Tax=Seminavis robusta TaxID=568900 RepID=A0A9N8H895_9STRA|nr:unknown protein [Seminavis robusta]|eukprot:Sro163_g073010.1 n/a (98) ;mRNA; f:1638-1931